MEDTYSSILQLKQARVINLTDLLPRPIVSHIRRRKSILHRVPLTRPRLRWWGRTRDRSYGQINNAGERSYIRPLKPEPSVKGGLEHAHLERRTRESGEESEDEEVRRVELFGLSKVRLS